MVKLNYGNPSCDGESNMGVWRCANRRKIEEAEVEKKKKIDRANYK